MKPGFQWLPPLLTTLLRYGIIGLGAAIGLTNINKLYHLPPDCSHIYAIACHKLTVLWRLHKPGALSCEDPKNTDSDFKHEEIKVCLPPHFACLHTTTQNPQFLP